MDGERWPGEGGGVMFRFFVIPAKAGIPLFVPAVAEGSGTPAFAGVTEKEHHR